MHFVNDSGFHIQVALQFLYNRFSVRIMPAHITFCLCRGTIRIAIKATMAASIVDSDVFAFYTTTGLALSSIFQYTV